MNKKYNDFDLSSNDYGIGFTLKGEPFYFDKDDYEKIKNICWYKDTVTGYIRGTIGGIRKKTSLHRIVMNVGKNELVDHINHDLSDNRKCNLRICNRSENKKNSVTREDNSSGFPGVYFDKVRNKWEVQITSFGKRCFLGRFDSKEEAIKIKEKAENQLFGEYSYSNSIDICHRIQKDGDKNGKRINS